MGRSVQLVQNCCKIKSNKTKCYIEEAVEIWHLVLHGNCEDGLNVVRDICSRMQEWCYNSSQHDERSFNATCWMELDSSHHCSISSFLETEFPHISVVDRFVQLQVQPTKRN